MTTKLCNIVLGLAAMALLISATGCDERDFIANLASGSWSDTYFDDGGYGPSDSYGSTTYISTTYVDTTYVETTYVDTTYSDSTYYDTTGGYYDAGYYDGGYYDGGYYYSPDGKSKKRG
jgi:hypothetical protein